jgi:hypothetical protein
MDFCPFFGKAEFVIEDFILKIIGFEQNADLLSRSFMVTGFR